LPPEGLFHNLKHVEIMEERYEIRGKIGQGGLGAVYRGFDTRMNREVAIKRISVSNGDSALQEESTRQLIKEAGALASLQHPNIVTIYDVGTDADGPFVVMELISGKTLDELIERAPLTWPDFRELAIQTQEALIAAHELSLVHGDIKPSNLMLTWLPSGKFQIKIVDFGLATLNQSQTAEELEAIDAVFGSIFFMAPEQFERVPLDARVDIYAMGCVYYQSLTGIYPFKGETGHEVMVSHLHHKVTPLQDVRADIPLWVCDWIMWMINRQPADRPDSARGALQVFFQNDKAPNPTKSLGKAVAATPSGPRARLPIPGGAQAASPTKRVINDPRLAPPGYVAPTALPPEAQEPAPEPEPATPITAPQPLLPPEGSKPSIYTPDDPPVVTTTVPTGRLMPTPTTRHTKPQVGPTKGKGANQMLKIAAGAVAAIVVFAGIGFFLLERIKKSRESQRLSNMLVEAAAGGASEFQMSASDLTYFLDAAANADTEEKQKSVFNVLALAKPNDGADFDTSIAEFAAKSTQLLPEVREQLIREVFSKRTSNAVAGPLIEFARSTKDTASGIAALQAIRTTARDPQFEALLSILQFHPNEDFRKAAEDAATEILKKSADRAKLSKTLSKTIESVSNPKLREPLVRLKKAAG
jgi:serine/threonine protein kinase